MFRYTKPIHTGKRTTSVLFLRRGLCSGGVSSPRKASSSKGSWGGGLRRNNHQRAPANHPTSVSPEHSPRIPSQSRLRDARLFRCTKPIHTGNESFRFSTRPSMHLRASLQATSAQQSQTTNTARSDLVCTSALQPTKLLGAGSSPTPIAEKQAFSMEDVWGS